ncbi:MAG: MFS transporter [Dehalococcoidia bacterium]
MLLFHSFGLYVVELERDFGWSKTRLAIAFSLARVEDGLLGPLQGWLLDRFGPRAVMRVGILIFAGGFVAFSQINSLPMFYITFVIMAVGAALGGFLTVTTSIVNWFIRRRTLAVGIGLIGTAVGGLLQPLVALILEEYGWRGMALLSSVIILVVGLPMAQLVRHRPEPYGLLPDGDTHEQLAARQAAAEADGTHQPEVNFTLREALRVRAFWVISLAHAAALLVVSAVMVHFVAHVKESLGYSSGEAATLIAFLTAMTIIGQLAGGWAGDRWSSRWLIAACMVGHGVALVMLAVATSLWMVLGFAVLHGLAWGVRGPVILAMRAEYFGRASYGTIMGFSSLIVMLGMFIGPVFAGLMYDSSGNYETGFTLLAVIAGAGSLLMLLAQKPGPGRPAFDTDTAGPTPARTGTPAEA